MNRESDQTVEDALRLDLAEGDAMVGMLAPILRHLLVNDDRSLFSDETVARVRGMIDSIAGQLLRACEASVETCDEDWTGDYADALTGLLLGDAPLLTHLHALAVEWQLGARLQAETGLDPVLSPLLQELIASSEQHTAETAMAALAAQARFVQGMRRMEIPITELPGDHFHFVLTAMRSLSAQAEPAANAEASLRTAFDESASRLGLIAQLVTGMGGGALAALSVQHAGVGIFLSALAIGSVQERDLAVLSTNRRLHPRLALGLCATGLKPGLVLEQIAQLDPEYVLPEEFAALRPDRAAALLAASTPRPLA